MQQIQLWNIENEGGELCLINYGQVGEGADVG
jgi:hypothetical protein